MTRESLENVSSLSRAQLETVAEIVLAGGVFSMLGCVVIIAVFLHASHLRTSFAFQLVFGLSIAEFGNATWPMFFMPDGDTAACTTQALTAHTRTKHTHETQACTTQARTAQARTTQAHTM